MFSWRSIRTFFLILLLLPIVHLVYLVSRDTLATMAPPGEAWLDHMARYAQEDSSTKLPRDPIVVVGGLRVQLWDGLEEVLAPEPVLMRGLGDAIIDDLIHHHERLIAFYRPEVLVIFPGNSEFHIRDNKSPEELLQRLQQLVALDRGLDPERRIVVIAPVKTILFPGDHDKIDTAITLLNRWAEQDGEVELIDPNPLLCGLQRRPDPRYFRSDGMNLNEHGYLRLSTLVQNRLEEDG